MAIIIIATIISKLEENNNDNNDNRCGYSITSVDNISNYTRDRTMR
jgi:hypothetical protein